jgi:PAS domain S-box-containing protein
MEYLWRHPHGFARAECSHGATGPSSLSSKNLKSSYRNALLAISVLCFLAHAFVLAFLSQDQSRFFSNILQFILGLAAFLALLDAGRRSQRAARWIWCYAAAAIGTYTLGQLIFIGYSCFGHGFSCAPRITDQFFFFWAAPLLAAAAFDTLGWQDGFDSTLLLDLAQLVILGLALHVSVFGNSSRWYARPQEMEFLKLKVRFIRDVVVLGWLWGRAWLTSSRQLRSVFLRLGLFYLSYSLAEAVYLSAEAVWHVQPGTWLDILWSLPRLLAIVLALSWKWNEVPDASSRLQRSRSHIYLQRAPIIVPMLMLALAFRTFSSAPFLWASLMLASFALASARLLVTQARQERTLVELQGSNDLLHSIIEGTSEAIYLKDPDGRYKLINTAGAQYMGLSPQQVLGKTDQQLLSRETIGPILKIDREVLSKGVPVTCEEELIEGGVTRTFLSTKNPYRDSEGGVAGVLGISVEITERRRMEEQLRRSQRMESIGAFSGAIAHDFSNLLTVIKGYSQLTLDEVGEKGEVSGNLEQVVKATDRAAALIRQLLAFSRQQVLQPRVISLNDVISHLQKMLHRLIGEHIQIVTGFASDLWAVKADPGQIEQVVMNLAANSRDAMSDGGTLTVETCNVVLAGACASSNLNLQPGEYVMLAVSDSGAGMDAQTQARIFEPFFTTKQSGTGLGLATVYGIIKQSGGSISVDSRPGVGTTFKIYLPRVSQPLEHRSEAPPIAEVDQSHETILLVEDDVQVREFTATALNKCGYTVLTARTPHDAATLAAQHGGPIHLLLTDVIMPGTSGTEIARQIVDQRPETRVLYISGYSGDAILHHGVPDAGINFLQKPFTPSSLVERVRRVLESSAPARPGVPDSSL